MSHPMGHIRFSEEEEQEVDEGQGEDDQYEEEEEEEEYEDNEEAEYDEELPSNDASMSWMTSSYLPKDLFDDASILKSYDSAVEQYKKAHPNHCQTQTSSLAKDKSQRKSNDIQLPSAFDSLPKKTTMQVIEQPPTAASSSSLAPAPSVPSIISSPESSVLSSPTPSANIESDKRPPGVVVIHGLRKRVHTLPPQTPVPPTPSSVSVSPMSIPTPSAPPHPQPAQPSISERQQLPAAQEFQFLAQAMSIQPVEPSPSTPSTKKKKRKLSSTIISGAAPQPSILSSSSGLMSSEPQLPQIQVQPQSASPFIPPMSVTPYNAYPYPYGYSPMPHMPSSYPFSTPSASPYASYPQFHHHHHPPPPSPAGCSCACTCFQLPSPSPQIQTAQLQAMYHSGYMAGLAAASASASAASSFNS